jgi:hypothetical protein
MSALSSNPIPRESGPNADSNPLADSDIEPGLGVDASAVMGDRSFDFSLRMLTVLVLVALAGSIGLLAYRWLAPQLAQFQRGPVPITTALPKPPPAKTGAGPAKGDEVLMDPRHVFRCEEQGRVTFSDRACPGEGAAGRPAPPAPGH